MTEQPELDALLAAIRRTATIQDHPDWPGFKARKIPAFITFYYTNQNGQEAYWDQARVIKLDLNRLLLVIEGAHGDPLTFDATRVMHCKDARTGEKVQDLFFDWIRLWRDTYEGS